MPQNLRLNYAAKSREPGSRKRAYFVSLCETNFAHIVRKVRPEGAKFRPAFGGAKFVSAANVFRSRSEHISIPYALFVFFSIYVFR